MSKLLFVFLLGCVSFACGPNAKQKTVQVTLVAVNTARDAFIVYDDNMQSKIVEAATSLEQGRADLARWRERRVEMIEAFELAYRSLAIASTDLSDQNVAEMVAVALALKQTFSNITGAGSP